MACQVYGRREKRADYFTDDRFYDREGRCSFCIGGIRVDFPGGLGAARAGRDCQQFSQPGNHQHPSDRPVYGMGLPGPPANLSPSTSAAAAHAPARAVSNSRTAVRRALFTT